MSTRCMIAVCNHDGTLDAIYCHHDGYFEYVGEILSNTYDTEEKVRNLISLGDLSVLGESTEFKQYDGCPFPAPAHGYTFAYHRDCGEDLCIRHYDSFDAFVKAYNPNGTDIEYLYWFKNNNWNKAHNVKGWYEKTMYKFTVEVSNLGDVFVDGKFVSQLCFDEESVGYAVADYLKGLQDED